MNRGSVACTQGHCDQYKPTTTCMQHPARKTQLSLLAGIRQQRSFSLGCSTELCGCPLRHRGRKNERKIGAKASTYTDVGEDGIDPGERDPTRCDGGEPDM